MTTLRHTHVLLAAEALKEILLGEKPADVILAERFRLQRSAGSKDRAQISALVYGVLRNYFPLRALLGESAAGVIEKDFRSPALALGAAETLQLCAAQVLSTPNHTLPPLRELDAAALHAQLAQSDPSALTQAARHNLPEWLWQKLQEQYGEREASALALALNEPAPVDLRVNTFKATREQAIEKLAQAGIASEATPHSPVGVRLKKRVALQSSAAFREGWVEPQDEGSQRLALHVAPMPGERVADFCAGAGGKTLALGAQMNNQGELWAFDVSRARLSRLEPRLLRSGLSIVRSQVLATDGTITKEHSGYFDAVLVDAPCSATGTLRRNPELRLRTPDLGALQKLQLEILGRAADLVRDGGRLIYATCSILREENEAVVERFLQTHSGFSAGAELRLLPHRDGTDGFYAVTLRRG